MARWLNLARLHRRSPVSTPRAPAYRSPPPGLPAAPMEHVCHVCVYAAGAGRPERHSAQITTSLPGVSRRGSF